MLGFIDFSQLTDENLQKRIDFAHKIKAQCREHNKDDTLPKHLQTEYMGCVMELNKRKAIKEAPEDMT